MDKKQTPKPSVPTNDSDRAQVSDEAKAPLQVPDALLEDAPTVSFTSVGASAASQDNQPAGAADVADAADADTHGAANGTTTASDDKPHAEQSDAEVNAETSSAESDSTGSDADRDSAFAADAQPEESESKRSGKRMTYSKTMRFIVAPIFAVIALISMVFAVLSATVWKPSPIATATGSVSTRYAATDSGVLQLVDSYVRVRAAAKQPVCVAVGNSQDITGWIGSQPYTRIEGLETWKKLKTAAAQNGLGSSASNAGQTTAFSDSDLWTQVRCGTSIDFTVKPTPTQAVIIDTNPTATDSSQQGVPTKISLTWRRTSVGNQSVPLSFASILLLIAAVLCATVLAMMPERRRKSLERRQAEEERLRQAREQGGERRVIGTGEDSPRWVKDNVRLKRQLAGRRRHRHTSHRKAGGFLNSLRPAPRKRMKQEEAKREQDESAQTMVLNPKAILGLAPENKAAEGQGADTEPTAAEITGTGPKVVDIRGVNLVADTVSRRQAEETAELTAIINGDAPTSAESAAASGVDTSTPSKQYSSDEIADYLRRLSEETLGFDGDNSGSDSNGSPANQTQSAGSADDASAGNAGSATDGADASSVDSATNSSENGKDGE